MTEDITARVLASFLERQDATEAAYRSALLAAGATAEQLEGFDLIAETVRERMARRIPGYVAAMTAMVERDLVGAKEH